MARGRKRKANLRRTKSGRISRAGIQRFDKGTDRAQAIQALYGADGADAIGRAYRSGLLGEGQDAKALLDTSRRICHAYWSVYQVGGVSCTLADKTGGHSEAETEAARRREEWLNECMDIAKRYSTQYRRSFEQLCVEINSDSGPCWLDRLCFASRNRRVFFEPSDTSALDRALEILSEIAGVEKPHIVRLKAA